MSTSISKLYPVGYKHVCNKNVICKIMQNIREPAKYYLADFFC